MNLLKALGELYDRVLFGFAIVVAVVWIASREDNGYASLSSLWSLAALAAIPLTAAAIAWGARPTGTLLFLYGAISGGISLFVLLLLSDIRFVLVHHRVSATQTQWIIGAGTLAIGIMSGAAGRFVSSRTFPRYNDHWPRLKRTIRAKITWPSFATTLRVSPLLLSVAFFAASYWLDARRRHLELGSNAFIGVSRGHLSFFSDGQYGPYQGSIVALTDGVHPPDFDESAFSFPGIYYRWFGFKTGPFWTLTVTLLFPIALALIPVELLVIRRLAHRGDRGRDPFQFSLRSLCFAMFWFCAAAALASIFATDGYRHTLPAYAAIIATCLGIGTICRGKLAGVLVGTTLVLPCILCPFIGRIWR